MSTSFIVQKKESGVSGRGAGRSRRKDAVIILSKAICILHRCIVRSKIDHIIAADRDSVLYPLKALPGSLQRDTMHANNTCCSIYYFCQCHDVYVQCLQLPSQFWRHLTSVYPVLAILYFNFSLFQRHLPLPPNKMCTYVIHHPSDSRRHRTQSCRVAFACCRYTLRSILWQEYVWPYYL